MNPFVSDGDGPPGDPPHPVPGQTFQLDTVSREPVVPDTRDLGPTKEVLESSTAPLDNDKRPSSCESHAGLSEQPSASKDTAVEHHGINDSSVLWSGVDRSHAGLLRRRQNGWAAHLKAWAPEAAWCLLTIGILIALVVVLSMYNNQRLPEWPLGLTLNTVVALLATLCRSVIVVPIAEGISQLKWNWFVARQRPLKSLYIFDQASRGPWGSLRLMFTMRGRLMPLSYLASLVLFTGLVTSFLTQSAIAYDTRLILSYERSRAVVRQTQAFPTISNYSSAEQNQDLQDSLERIAYQAAFIHVDDSASQSDPTCPSGDCRWPEFSSLSVCVSMSNVTDKLEVEETEDESGGAALKASLMDGKFYLLEGIEDEEVVQAIVNMTAPEADSLSFPNERDSAADWENPDLIPSTFSQMFVVYTNDNVSPYGKDLRYRAVEVLWHFCVQTYEVAVTDGIPQTRIIDTKTKINEVVTRDAPGVIDEAFIMENAAGTDTFNVTSTSLLYRLEQLFSLGFSGQYSVRFGLSEGYNHINAQLGKNLFTGVEPNTTIEDADAKMWDNLESLSLNIAQSITTHLRDTEPSGDISGEILAPETFIVVRWEWLSFIAVQIGLAIVFLLAIIINTAKLDVNIVKSSNIAELFALQSQREGMGEESPLPGIDSKVRESVMATLKRKNDRWNLELEKSHTESGRDKDTST